MTKRKIIRFNIVVIVLLVWVVMFLLCERIITQARYQMIKQFCKDERAINTELQNYFNVNLIRLPDKRGEKDELYQGIIFNF